jgi:hypothetical protein
MGMRFWGFVGVIAVLSCVVGGCGGGDGFDRVPLAGTVSCDEMQSINGGLLATPAETGSSAPNVSAPITDGKFDLPKERGPIAGSYIFEISLQIPGAKPPSGQSPEGENETGPEITYRKTLDVPQGGSDSLAIELTSADRAEESALP